MVLTDEKQLDVYPAATFEKTTGVLALEQSFYTINLADTISTSRIASLSTTAGKLYLNNNGNPPYNNDPYLNTTDTSRIVYKLNGSTGDKTGLGITLKVMAGDVVNIYGKSFWHSNGTNPSNTYLISSALSSFISGFAGTPGVAGSGKGATATALSNSAGTTSWLTSWLNSVPNPSLASILRAYINWILFDEQFKPVSSGFGYDVLAGSDTVKSHNRTVPIGTGGYLYVYCSNESNVDVFFDNLQVMHTRGPLFETDSYYPYGLAMAGISSQAAAKLENLHKYNKGSELQHKEFSDGSGLETYTTQFRMLDPQIGRWWQLDPKIESGDYELSPYISMSNNPVSRIDPLGDLDDYWVRRDGSIEKTETSDKFDRIIIAEQYTSS